MVEKKKAAAGKKLCMLSDLACFPLFTYTAAQNKTSHAEAKLFFP
jgi:hypothetical protein